MPKRVRRGTGGKASGSRHTPRDDRPGQRNDELGPRDTRDDRGLLARLLDTPHLALAVPRLPPEMLQRIIQTCGLEDCGDLVALATPDQLNRVFDLDLWRPPKPGLDEQLDADRFATWLDVLMESGAEIAAQKIVGVNVDLVIAALAEHILVFDGGAVSSFESTDGEVTEHRRSIDRPGCEVAGYLVEAKRTHAWDSIVALLLCLAAEHPDHFHRVMRGCRNLSNSGFEVDGLHDLLDAGEQDMFDLAVDREGRRERQGYVMPAQARAFLHQSRQLDREAATAPAPDPVARAYFRAFETTPPTDEPLNQDVGLLPAASGSPDVQHGDPDPLAAVVDLLREAGVLTQPPRALLDAPQDRESRLAWIQTHMQIALALDPVGYSRRTEELAYLANTLLAGCSIQARPFTDREASDAALAICNLGLENWPRHWILEKPHRPSAVERDEPLPEYFLIDHDLISVFQVGWAILHRDVCMHAAERLIKVLNTLSCDDRDIQSGLDALRSDMARHSRAGTPWRARDALDVVAILDMPVWAALLGLIDECPVIHAGLSISSGTRAISASDFTFISENSQIASVREFMQSLPERLQR